MKLTLAVERLPRHIARKYLFRLRGEVTPVAPSMEDLPLYEETRRLLRQAKRLRVREHVVRSVEQPSKVADQMEEKTPQFFLRNTHRVERYIDPDFLEFDYLETRDAKAENVVLELRGIRYEPPQFHEVFNIEHVKWLRALLKRLLWEEDWTRYFSKEIKEHIKGPIFKYDPNARQEDSLA